MTSNQNIHTCVFIMGVCVLIMYLFQCFGFTFQNKSGKNFETLLKAKIHQKATSHVTSCFVMIEIKV